MLTNSQLRKAIKKLYEAFQVESGREPNTLYAVVESNGKLINHYKIRVSGHFDSREEERIWYAKQWKDVYNACSENWSNRPTCLRIVKVLNVAREREVEDFDLPRELYFRVEASAKETPKDTASFGDVTKSTTAYEQCESVSKTIGLKIPPMGVRVRFEDNGYKFKVEINRWMLSKDINKKTDYYKIMFMLFNTLYELDIFHNKKGETESVDIKACDNPSKFEGEISGRRIPLDTIELEDWTQKDYKQC